MNTTSVRVKIGTAVPTTMLMLTPAFLSDVLQADVQSVKVLKTNIGNGITGSIIRIALEYHSFTPGAPATLIAKFSAFDEAVRRECNRMGFYGREVYFYSELAERTDARTPICYYAAYDVEQGHSLLLLEDLTDHVRPPSSIGCSIERAREAVQAMARLHAGWWDHAELKDNPWMFRAPGSWSEPFEAMWESFRVGMGLGDSPEIRRMEEILRQGLPAAERLLAQGPLTLIHNDFQLDNLTFGPRDGAPEVVLLDWGIYTAARGASDMAYLLTGSLSIEDRRAGELALLQEYVDALARAGVRGYTLEQSLEDYRHAILIYYCRAIIAICTVGMIDGPTGRQINPRTVESFTPVLQRYHAAILDHFAVD